MIGVVKFEKQKLKLTLRAQAAIESELGPITQIEEALAQDVSADRLAGLIAEVMNQGQGADLADAFALASDMTAQELLELFMRVVAAAFGTEPEALLPTGEESKPAGNRQARRAEKAGNSRKKNRD